MAHVDNPRNVWKFLKLLMSWAAYTTNTHCVWRRRPFIFFFSLPPTLEFYVNTLQKKSDQPLQFISP
jgi:hypothetical protein